MYIITFAVILPLNCQSLQGSYSREILTRKTDQERITKMGDLLNLLKDRYSERRFDPEKDVEEEKLDLLLEAARLAPTAHNNQAFRLYL